MASADAGGPWPREIQQAGPAELRITWNDGHVSLYPVADLRRSCRCASCVEEWSGRRLLDPAAISDRVRPIQVSPVGRYAITIAWNDGHSSGIFTYEYLRSLCPCPACKGAQAQERGGA